MDVFTFGISSFIKLVTAIVVGVLLAFLSIITIIFPQEVRERIQNTFKKAVDKNT